MSDASRFGAKLNLELIPGTPANALVFEHAKLASRDMVSVLEQLRTVLNNPITYVIALLFLADPRPDDAIYKFGCDADQRQYARSRDLRAKFGAELGQHWQRDVFE